MKKKQEETKNATFLASNKIEKILSSNLMKGFLLHNATFLVFPSVFIAIKLKLKEKIEKRKFRKSFIWTYLATHEGTFKIMFGQLIILFR